MYLKVVSCALQHTRQLAQQACLAVLRQLTAQRRLRESFAASASADPFASVVSCVPVGGWEGIQHVAAAVLGTKFVEVFAQILAIWRWLQEPCLLVSAHVQCMANNGSSKCLL